MSGSPRVVRQLGTRRSGDPLWKHSQRCAAHPVRGTFSDGLRAIFCAGSWIGLHLRIYLARHRPESSLHHSEMNTRFRIALQCPKKAMVARTERASAWSSGGFNLDPECQPVSPIGCTPAGFPAGPVVAVQMCTGDQ